MQEKFLVTGSNGAALYNFKQNAVFKLTAAEAQKFACFSYKKADLARYLKQNKAVHFKHINLELTNQCNLRCKHCYGGTAFGTKQKELFTNQWKKIIRQITKFKPKFLLFTGGECLLRKDFNELLLFAHKLGQQTSVFSSLALLSGENISALKQAGSVVQFSAYGHTAKLHDSITCIKGSFAAQQNALKKLKKAGIPLHGQVILMKENISYKNKIKKLFQRLKIPVEFSIARPSGRQTEQGIPGCSTCSFPSGYIESAGQPASIDFDFFVLKHFYNDCWAQRCGITSQGKVLACVFARDKILGDLKKESFSAAYKRILKNAASHPCDKINGCKECCLRYACMDCRPWAKALTGDWKGKNPYCKEKV